MPEIPVHGLKDGQQIVLRMHHELVGMPPRGFEVDHLNRKRLDNRRQNLRILTKAANRQNRTVNRTSRSGRRGVTWNEQKGKWRAVSKRNGRNIYLGHFDDPVEAERVVVAWRMKHMPYSVEKAVA